MRTLSDITYEPHRLVVLFAVGGLVLGLLGGLVTRAWWFQTLPAMLVLVGGFLLFPLLHDDGDLGVEALAGLVAAVALVAGFNVLGHGPTRALGVTLLGCVVVLTPVLWVRDLTPPISAQAATLAYERQYHASHYRCARSFNTYESVEISQLEFQCDSTEPTSFCRVHGCPRVWFGVDGRGRIRDHDMLLSAP